VILVSARAQESDIESGLAAGADAYLAKPFQAADLIGLVQGFLA
jgi:CheY-like chemotaxis protein